jgi:hypothetical protein
MNGGGQRAERVPGQMAEGQMAPGRQTAAAPEPSWRGGPRCPTA